MAQNISLWGANYTDIPALKVPKTGGGEALFADPSITTAVASDVASGKKFLLADGSEGTGTASGGGGASNIATGTFTGTTTGAAMDVTLSYSGTKYPIALYIYPKGGATANSTFNSLVKRYVFQIFAAIKSDVTATPGYRGSAQSGDSYMVTSRYKSSTSNASSYTNQSWTSATIATSGASSSLTLGACFKSRVKLSVYIASNSYGFAPNIEYEYIVVYAT